jgi:hypothetical protein
MAARPTACSLIALKTKTAMEPISKPARKAWLRSFTL